MGSKGESKLISADELHAEIVELKIKYSEIFCNGSIEDLHPTLELIKGEGEVILKQVEQRNLREKAFYYRAEKDEFKVKKK